MFLIETLIAQWQPLPVATARSCYRSLARRSKEELAAKAAKSKLVKIAQSVGLKEYVYSQTFLLDQLGEPPGTVTAPAPPPSAKPKRPRQQAEPAARDPIVPLRAESGIVSHPPRS